MAEPAEKAEDFKKKLYEWVTLVVQEEATYRRWCEITGHEPTAREQVVGRFIRHRLPVDPDAIARLYLRVMWKHLQEMQGLYGLDFLRREWALFHDELVEMGRIDG